MLVLVEGFVYKLVRLCTGRLQVHHYILAPLFVLVENQQR